MAKTRRYLSDLEAEHLGLELNNKQKGKNLARYVIKEKEWEEVLSLRRIPNNREFVETLVKKDKNGKVTSSLEKLQSEPVPVPDDFELIKISTSKTTGQQWTQYAPKKKDDQQDTVNNLEAAISELKKDIPKAEIVSPIAKIDDDKLCNQYTLTDYHLGLMAWAEESGSDWDVKIAEQILVDFFKIAMERSPLANNAIFAQIGDFLHWDGLDAVTPQSKHVLDADTRFTKLVRVTIRVIRKVIKMLLEKYQHVTVIMAEGNHDMASSVWLREVLSSFYSEEPRLTIDVNPDPYYCVTWGKCSLFYHHGHKRNIKNIDHVFVSKFKKEFGNSDFAYGHLGHLHHELKNETNLMILEQHRTLAAKDAYSARGGYGSGRDSKVITYHKDFGEVGRSIVSIDLIESMSA